MVVSASQKKPANSLRPHFGGWRLWGLDLFATGSWFSESLVRWALIFNIQSRSVESPTSYRADPYNTEENNTVSFRTIYYFAVVKHWRKLRQDKSMTTAKVLTTPSAYHLL